MTGYETILVDRPAPHVLRVTMNRPEAGNAKNTRMGLELLEVWSALAADPGDVRCAILTGAGDRIFSGGGDLKERRGMTDAAWHHQHAIFERGRDALLAVPVPVIAAVNGHAFGGGCENLLACDFAYAVSTATFALPEVTRGIMPGGGGTQFLPRAAGERRAKEIIFTGRPFTAAEAMEWGIVNRVCEPGTLMDAVLDTACAIAANAPRSLRQAKKAIHHGMQVDIRQGLDFEIEAYNALIHTEDRREGVLAYSEKRKPDFKGH